jgi:hypothetical protein
MLGRLTTDKDRDVKGFSSVAGKSGAVAGDKKMTEAEAQKELDEIMGRTDSKGASAGSAAGSGSGSPGKAASAEAAKKAEADAAREAEERKKIEASAQAALEAAERLKKEKAEPDGKKVEQFVQSPLGVRRKSVDVNPVDVTAVAVDEVEVCARPRGMHAFACECALCSLCPPSVSLCRWTRRSRRRPKPTRRTVWTVIRKRPRTALRTVCRVRRRAAAAAAAAVRALRH